MLPEDQSTDKEKEVIDKPIRFDVTQSQKKTIKLLSAASDKTIKDLIISAWNIAYPDNTI